MSACVGWCVRLPEVLSPILSRSLSLFLFPFVAGGLILNFFPNSVRFGVFNAFSGHVFDPVPQKHVLNPPTVWGLRWCFFHNSGRLHVVPPKFQTQRQISRHITCFAYHAWTILSYLPNRDGNRSTNTIFANRHPICQDLNNSPILMKHIHMTYVKKYVLYICIHMYCFRIFH